MVQSLVAHGTLACYMDPHNKKAPKTCPDERLACQGFVSVKMKKMTLAESKTPGFEICFQEEATLPLILFSRSLFPGLVAEPLLGL